MINADVGFREKVCNFHNFILFTAVMLNLSVAVVTIVTTYFNVQNLFIFPTQCIYILRVQ